MIISDIPRKFLTIVAVVAALLPSLVQAFIPPVSAPDGETPRYAFEVGWNLVAESVTDKTITPESTTLRLYTWGLDLAGQRGGRFGQTAGGIGGLLAITEIDGTVTNVYYPISDHIGSIRGLVDADTGALVAEYEYDTYGVLLEEVGERAEACPFRFSSKYYDPETQLLYFGYRYYNPASTKWLTVDPLQERGGLNLTVYCGGDPVNQVDPLGLYWQRNVGGKWEWVSGSSCILEDMVSPGIDTIAQIGQAVPDVWSGLWGGLQKIRIPESQGNGFVSAAWNGVAGAGNGILAPLATAAEPRPQDYDDGLLMVNEALWGRGIGFSDRVKLGGVGVFVFVGSALDVVDFVPDPVDAMQKGARETGLDILRRSSMTTKGDGLNWVTEIPKGSRPHPAK